MLGSTIENKGVIVTYASPSLVEKDLRANDIVKNISTQLGGKGGGRPNFAMGGGPLTHNLEDAFRYLETSTVDILKTNSKSTFIRSPRALGDLKISMLRAGGRMDGGT
mgnify:CR=1 FL=1